MVRGKGGREGPLMAEKSSSPKDIGKEKSCERLCPQARFGAQPLLAAALGAEITHQGFHLVFDKQFRKAKLSAGG